MFAVDVDSDVPERKQKPSGSGDQAQGFDSSCVVCFDNVADTVLVPCHHLILCSVSLFHLLHPHILYTDVATSSQSFLSTS